MVRHSLRPSVLAAFDGDGYSENEPALGNGIVPTRQPFRENAKGWGTRLLSMLCVPPFENREGWGNLNCEWRKGDQPAVGLTNSVSGHAANELLLLPTQQVPEK